jgi:hypothetical protein
MICLTLANQGVFTSINIIIIIVSFINRMAQMGPLFNKLSFAHANFEWIPL